MLAGVPREWLLDSENRALEFDLGGGEGVGICDLAKFFYIWGGIRKNTIFVYK